MNKDLKEYINTFEKLDDQALFDIGMALRSLPLKERDWSELLGYLDIDRFNEKGENYRKWVSKKVSEGWFVEHKSELLSTSDTLVIRSRESFKDKIRANDVLNAYRKELRDTARLEQFEDNLIQAIGNIPELTPVKFEGKIAKNSKSEAVLLFSDLHIGNECNNFYNKYNIEIAKERVAKIVAYTIKYCKQNDVKVLNVINLGDLIHGYIHTNARVNEQFDVATQVSVAAEILSEVLNELQKAAPTVTYRSCSDNHSRMVANKEEAIDVENFGRLIDDIVKLRLQNTKINFCNDNLDYGLGKFNLMNGQICMFAHGHQDHQDKVIQELSGALKIVPDYVFLGHKHNTKLKSFQGSKVFVNGSVVGTEEYALSNRLFGKPEQTLLIFDDNNVQDIILGLN